MCVNPYIVRNKDGNLVPVPCGKCFECMRQWEKDWRFRLNVEKRDSVASVFLTLTYNDDNLPVAYNDDACEWQSFLVKKDLQDFFKRVRKNCKQLKFRYFALGEYGGDYNRCHFHVVFFFKDTANLSFNQLYRLFLYCWNKGFIYLKATEKRHINYVSKYFNKIDKSSHITQPFKCMSKHFGLSWLTEKIVDYLFTSFKTGIPNPFGKGFIKIPRYYRKKLDEMTDYVEPNNYGYLWSDIVRMREFKPKRESDIQFDWFCKNYDEVFRWCYRKVLNETVGIGMHNLYMTEDTNPNTVFQIWSRYIPQIIHARNEDNINLDNAKVKHKYTKLNERLILYG